MIVLTDTPAEAKELEDKLQADWDRAPKDAKPFIAVRTLWSAVPDDQATKIPILREIADKLERARGRGFVTDADWAKVKDYLLPADVKPYGLADLPEPLARPYSEKDGTRGRLVVIEPEAEQLERPPVPASLLRLVPRDAPRVGQDRPRARAARSSSPTS